MGVVAIDLPRLPALVEGEVVHTRRTPMHRRFTNHVYQWLVDLDELPRMRRPLRSFSSFLASDHIGDPNRSIRANIENFCAANGTDIAGQQILMLANARVFGHTFDPLSVFWVIAPDRTVTCIIAEVHNTYGERHAYLLTPDAEGRAQTDKEFYVSPFFTVEGGYDLQFRLGPDVVSSSVILRQGGDAVFSATFRGTPVPATPSRLTRLLVKMPFLTHRISLLIRIQGVWLWLRRLPVVPRPPHQPQEGTK